MQDSKAASTVIAALIAFVGVIISVGGSYIMSRNQLAESARELELTTCFQAMDLVVSADDEAIRDYALSLMEEYCPDFTGLDPELRQGISRGDVDVELEVQDGKLILTTRPSAGFPDSGKPIYVPPDRFEVVQ